ncbi:MAG: UDP-3-O-(3-hydroxymyristoyl)glucosamine N-acyltransferase [Beijerinckiaceae bacterium]
MSDPVFFRTTRGLRLGEVLALAGATVPEDVDPQLAIRRVAPLDEARRGDLSYFSHPRHRADLAETRATAYFVRARHAHLVPASTIPLQVQNPHRAIAAVLAAFFPAAMRAGSVFGAAGVSPGAAIHPEARIEDGVIVDPGAVIGPRAEIGAGTTIASNAVIGPDVRIGRDCWIGPQSSVLFALIGDRVVLHAGVRIGQDGFGFAVGPKSHMKVPQVGRVIIQDDVEIGANTTIDRGTLDDTVIGEGTKIDNLVQVGHAAMIGRHCIIVAQSGISGSTTLGDFVMLGGQVGIAGHLAVGAGAAVAAQSGVVRDVAEGTRIAGTPARPARAYLRHKLALTRADGNNKRQMTGRHSSGGVVE